MPLGVKDSSGSDEKALCKAIGRAVGHEEASNAGEISTYLKVRPQTLTPKGARSEIRRLSG